MKRYMRFFGGLSGLIIKKSRIWDSSKARKWSWSHWSGRTPKCRTEQHKLEHQRIEIIERKRAKNRGVLNCSSTVTVHYRHYGVSTVYTASPREKGHDRTNSRNAPAELLKTGRPRTERCRVAAGDWGTRLVVTAAENLCPAV